MTSLMTSIPGLFSSGLQSQSSVSTATMYSGNSAQNSNESMDRIIHLRGAGLISELTAEKENLEERFVHSKRLIDEEIARLQRGGAQPSAADSNVRQTQKVYIPYEDQRQFNIIGRLLGPKGLTLKRMQAETQTKMSIMGRGSMKDKKKEEELRKAEDSAHSHLKDDLHVLVQAEAPYSSSKLAAGVSEVKKMLIPLEPGQPDMIAAKYLEQGIDGFPAPGMGHPSMESPRSRGEGRGGGRGGGGGGRSGGRGGGRGASRGGGGPGGRRGGGGGGGGARGGGRGDGRGGEPYGGDYLGREGHGRMPPSRGSEVGRYGDAPEVKRPLLEFEPERSYPPPERAWRDEPYERRGARSPRDIDRPPYGRGDTYSSMDSDPYYSSFSDAPQSRDYRHGLGGSNDWKSPRPSKKDYRHHPYQAPGSYY